MYAEDRFSEGRNQVEQKPITPAAQPTELELRAREAELKKRYEDPHRSEQARSLLLERKRLKEKEEARAEQLRRSLSQSYEGAEMVAGNKQKSFKENNDYVSSQVQALEKAQEDIKKKQAERGLFQKIKYRFMKDPLEDAHSRLLTIKAEHEGVVAKNEEQMRTIEKEKDTYLAQKESLHAELEQNRQQEHKRSKKSLLEKTRTINRNSREAIRNTFLSMESGELDVAKLAKENNAIVVHAIPLDGWSMKNTSMNNEEVDIEAMNAKEKARILLSQRPDVSASILSADKAVTGQDMFYPFGFILDGKMIAAYEGDEGTYADGHARRRKERYHGTLQSDTGNRFTQLSQNAAKKSLGGQYNESIVHQPLPKGILIDEMVLSPREDMGDTVKQIVSHEEGQRIQEELEKSGKIFSFREGVPTSGPNAGKHIAIIERKRTATEKAIEYAQENHPDLPVYLRRSDGIYNADGKKVTAEDIYS